VKAHETPSSTLGSLSRWAQWVSGLWKRDCHLAPCQANEDGRSHRGLTTLVLFFRACCANSRYSNREATKQRSILATPAGETR